jgi:nicotinate-nucleotide adenylyltransferase
VEDIQNMRLGLFGGTFDPVHFGHLLLAEQCREHCALDEVWFLPSGAPPHKTSADISAGQMRTEMLEFATSGHPAFQINTMELERKGPTFTVETLKELAEADSSRELFFLIGADSLNDFPSWREPARILEYANVVAVNRGNEPIADLDAVAARIGGDALARLRTVTIPGIDFSASDLRRRVRQGKSIRFMTPRAVEVYIAEHRLYVEET